MVVSWFLALNGIVEYYDTVPTTTKLTNDKMLEILK